MHDIIGEKKWPGTSRGYFVIMDKCWQTPSFLTIRSNANFVDTLISLCQVSLRHQSYCGKEIEHQSAVAKDKSKINQPFPIKGHGSNHWWWIGPKNTILNREPWLSCFLSRFIEILGSHWVQVLASRKVSSKSVQRLQKRSRKCVS